MLHIPILAQLATATPAPARPPSSPAEAPYVRLEVGGSLFTYQGPTSSARATTTGPSATFEKIAAGFWPIPGRVRLDFAGGPRETWTGKHPTVSSSLGASLRWRFVDLGWFFADLGLIAQVHQASTDTYDVGGTILAGLRARFSPAWSGTFEFHAPVWVATRFTVALTPLATVAYRF